MSCSLNFDEVDSTVRAVRNLRAAKADSEAKIAECLTQIAREKEMLAALLALPKTTANSEYLKAAKKAYRLGIKAWESSILALEMDVDSCQSDIDETLRRVPAARMDN